MFFLRFLPVTIPFSLRGVSYSQKFRGKRSFLNLVNNSISKFMLPRYRIEYHNVKRDSEIKISE